MQFLLISVTPTTIPALPSRRHQSGYERQKLKWPTFSARKEEKKIGLTNPSWAPPFEHSSFGSWRKKSVSSAFSSPPSPPPHHHQILEKELPSRFLWRLAAVAVAEVSLSCFLLGEFPLISSSSSSCHLDFFFRKGKDVRGSGNCLTRQLLRRVEHGDVEEDYTCSSSCVYVGSTPFRREKNLPAYM